MAVALCLTAALLVWLEVAFTSTAEEKGFAPRTARSVVDYRKSGDVPYWEVDRRPGRKRRWTPEEILDLLDAYPDYYIDMGVWTGVPTGGGPHREVGRIVNEVQALGRKRGVDTSRLMLNFRSDVYAKRTKGWWDCTVCDEKQECSDLCTWEGAMADNPFDSAWIMKIPRVEHEWAVEHIWQGDPSKDPWNSAGAKLWPDWVDRDAIGLVNTDTEVAALYGPVKDMDASALGTNYALNVSGGLMDLRNPQYRAWAIRKLIADLQVMGIDPGERAVIQYSYKPGWHVYYEGSSSGDRCSVSGSHMWTGPANPCHGIHPPGGPFARTPYGPGEFENALNAMLREIRAGLVAAGFAGVSLVTVERPIFGKKKWSILEPSVREAQWLIGDLAASCDRTNLSWPPNPLKCSGRDRGEASKGLEAGGELPRRHE